MTTDDASALEAYAAELGITFPLLADTDGRVSRRFNLFDEENGVSVRAVALIHDGRLVFTEEVEKTEVPGRLRPWAERLELS